MNDSHFNPLKIIGVTVTWEVENIWNLSFDGASSASFLLSDHIFHLFVRRYELSVAFYLCRDDAIPTVLSLLCNLSMVGQIGQEELIGEKEILIERGKEFVLIDSINIKDLEQRKDDFLTNDSLVVKCNVSSSYRRNLLGDTGTEEQNIVCFEKLSSDFERICNCQESADALLKVEDTEFPVHRTVLSARCPAIASNLGEETQEKAVNIADVKPAIFRDVLYYIYTGKVQALKADTAVPMFVAANRFALHELQKICLQFLQSNLTNDNIFDIAALAYDSGDLSLRDEVEKYIVKNLSAILQSDNWKDFCAKRYKFANDILTSVLLRMKESTDENQEN